MRDPEANPYTSIPKLALAVVQPHPDVRGLQIHEGFIYRDEIGQIVVFDMAFHHILRRGPPDFPYYWIKSALDVRLQRLICVWMDELWETNRSAEIPYSVVWSPGGYWDENKQFTKNELGEGLTCASFVISVFEAYGLPLLDLKSWPKRPNRQDRRWQRRVLSFLIDFGRRERIDVTEHVARQVRRLPSAVRFRPDQVGGAFGVFSGDPIAYDEAERLSIFVRRGIRLRRLTPKPFRPKRRPKALA